MFDSQLFLEFARDCQAGRAVSGEAALRSAVSRAYYAAYHRAWLFGVRQRKQQFPKNADAHMAVVAALRAFDLDLGDDLETLKRLRRRADYDLEYGLGLLEDDVQTAIDLAYGVFTRV